MLSMRRQLRSSHGIQSIHLAALIDDDAGGIAGSPSGLVQPSSSILTGLVIRGANQAAFDNEQASPSYIPMFLHGHFIMDVSPWTLHDASSTR